MGYWHLMGEYISEICKMQSGNISKLSELEKDEYYFKCYVIDQSGYIVFEN
jgi:hypothetical protein